MQAGRGTSSQAGGVWYREGDRAGRGEGRVGRRVVRQAGVRRQTGGVMDGLVIRNAGRTARDSRENNDELASAGWRSLA